MERIVLFDGDCNFCDASVQFILKRDPKGLFKFASLSSDIGKELLAAHHVDTAGDSFVLLENEQVYEQSTAALRIAKQLSGAWKFNYVFIVIPKPLRNLLYRFIARNRYKWFGKKESCILPSPEQRKRFLSQA